MIRVKGVLFIILLVTASVASAGTAEKPAQPNLEEVRAKALPVAQELMKTLEGRLREAMASGGPEAAIEVCQKQALELTETVRREKDIAYLKRVGVRIRNPENQPDADERRAIDYFLSEEGGSFPQDWVDTVTLPDGSSQLRYYRAIPMQARCLPCHGPADRMPERIRSALDERYPDDAARGFELGQLRGLLVVGLEPETTD